MKKRLSITKIMSKRGKKLLTVNGKITELNIKTAKETHLYQVIMNNKVLRAPGGTNKR